MMAEKKADKENKGGTEPVRVEVDPGICGFQCGIEAFGDGSNVKLVIQSDCEQIKKLGTLLESISLKDLFVPLSKSPIFISAETSRCHLACPVPWAVVKAAEVALGLALPKEAALRFL